jgi:2,3-dihydroxy-p-cumate/2,3-dihydroxybenzoate 3,4-dioxygenase
MKDAVTFATEFLGLEVSDTTKKATYLRSDDRAHTLCYFEGDPKDQIIGFEIDNEDQLDQSAATLEKLGHEVHLGTAEECELRKVKSFIGFNDPSGNQIEVVVRPQRKGTRYFASRDAGITGFSHVGLFSTDVVRDGEFWTQVCNAKVSDWVGDIPLMRINEIHHTLALAPAPHGGLQHINHQVESVDDVMRSYYFMTERNVPIIFGPGRHPTSGARFLYFLGPDNVVFEYSVGVSIISDDENHRPRQFGFEPSSLCMWGARTKPGLVD